ncbi:AraC-type DNA-binding protein [Acinetobacter marinus]|uniref:AraC-type DNA-binding protein n=1 Tax=Acinetobacter marinus TaxID=281375 RepID=A0A1G6NKR9_9GAMM|nr:AraC family transcriptional regulator [Acinetobacter marinus]SDC68241.1 AraC-type DNA-binding protein [Acinetobacter marinus]
MSQANSEKDWIFHASNQNNRFERIEAYFSNYAYAAHRHDTYAIGRTLSGVQSFHYRGEMQHSQSGMAMVLYPDEKHDGHAGSAHGFRYQMVYIEPSIIQNILQGQALPFIKHGLSTDTRVIRATHRFLQHMDRPLELLEEEDALYDLVIALNQSTENIQKNNNKFDYQAAQRAREYILSYPEQSISLDQLEQQTGRDRWSLSRDFRLLFGTSPHRYMTMRRLELVKIHLLHGEPIINAALLAGFFDQSHMTRHFIQAFGLSPAQWRNMQKAQ